MMRLGWINDTDLKSIVDQTRHQADSVRPGRFHDNQDLEWLLAGCVELVHQTMKSLWRLSNREGPTGFRPWMLDRNFGRRGGNIHPTKSLYSLVASPDVMTHSTHSVLDALPHLPL